MTNEEKAYEISQFPLIEDGIWHYATAEIAAIIMAEWKDKQFREYLEQKKAEIDRIDDYGIYTTEISLTAQSNLLDEIINELFGKTKQDNSDREE